MQITLAVIGKIKSGPELALFEHYAKRLPLRITVKEFDIKKPLTVDQRKEQEAELLLAACKDAEHIIALDEHGKTLSSTEFAAHLQKQQDNGMRKLAFVIGGADGLHASVLKRAQLAFSFGRITWPHMLMRGLLVEQLYRAHTILSNHPYHRE
jgi:23S rRNA (pseudouridine1915-N3)-methyltransferase